MLSIGRYSTHIDLWGVGCIFAEMCTAKPLFCGTSEADQLVKIFKVLGTPTLLDWPDLHKMPLYRPTLPVIKNPKRLKNIVTRLDPTGLSLLEHMLCYDPSKRISAAGALLHPFLAPSRGEWGDGGDRSPSSVATSPLPHPAIAMTVIPPREVGVVVSEAGSVSQGWVPSKRAESERTSNGKGSRRSRAKSMMN
jgi:serine/threonine protein kinase